MFLLLLYFLEEPSSECVRQMGLIIATLLHQSLLSESSVY